jgi:type II secretory pathway pseudopilin PulG
MARENFHMPATLGRRKRGAFTLVELLVVIGIIVVLIALLLPALRKARQASVNTVCASRLHSIAQACSAYLIDYKVYPLNYVNDAHQNIFPHDQQSRTLNQLSGYLNKFPDITDATPVTDLPPVLLCPWAEQTDSDGRKIVGNGNTYWYTGYAYYARLEVRKNWVSKGPPEVINYQNGTVLKLERVADDKGKRRGVLWGDAVVWFGPFNTWLYSHTTSSPLTTHTLLPYWHTNTKALHGQHQAWSDGSVEWVNGSTLKLDLATADKNASYGIGASYYWWF